MIKIKIKILENNCGVNPNYRQHYYIVTCTVCNTRILEYKTITTTITTTTTINITIITTIIGGIKRTVRCCSTTITAFLKGATVRARGPHFIIIIIIILSVGRGRRKLSVAGPPPPPSHTAPVGR